MDSEPLICNKWLYNEQEICLGLKTEQKYFSKQRQNSKIVPEPDEKTNTK